MAPVQSRVEVTPIRQRSNGGIVSSTTTTRSRILRSAGLVIAPLMLLGLAGCGDDDDGGGGDSAGGDKEAFCNDIKDISTQADEFEANSDDATPQELISQLGQLVDRMQQLDPPAEIEDDWNQSVDVLDTMASGDVEDLANFETTDEQDAAGDRVSQFLVDECGVDEDSFFGTA
jgi:hypothetical protein